MAKVKRGPDGHLMYRCPCGDIHAVTVDGPGAKWAWNGDIERPTFTPSVLVTTGHFITPVDTEKNGCWCTYNAEHPDAPATFGCYRCHTFVRDGVVQFLGDCTHKLAGQSVPISDWSHPEEQ